MRRLLLVLTIVLLGVCAASPLAHAEFSAPAPISDIYSDVNMRVQLATTKDVSKPCVGDECALNAEFDQRVHALGTRLSAVAFKAYPDLKKRIKHFDFVVAEKKEPGTISNAAGTIVIFRGVQDLELQEQALAFVIAREMGRVIDGQYDKNTGTSILLSVLATVLFPASGILQGIKGSAALANATSATTVLGTAASSATSFVGSQMVLAGVKPKQLREADAIAMRLLMPLDWSRDEVVGSLEACTHIDGEDSWQKDFRYSTAHVRTLVDDEEKMLASNDVKAEPLKMQVARNMKQEAEPGASNPSATSAIDAKTVKSETELKSTEMVAKNEASVSLDTATAADLTLPSAKFEEQQAFVEVQADERLAEESQSPHVVSAKVVKVEGATKVVQAKAGQPKPGQTRVVQAKVGQTKSGLTKVATKTAHSRVLSKDSSKQVSKVADKTAPIKAGSKLTKTAVGDKQMNTKKLYVSKDPKTKVAVSATPKRKITPALVKPVSVKSEQITLN